MKSEPSRHSWNLKKWYYFYICLVSNFSQRIFIFVMDLKCSTKIFISTYMVTVFEIDSKCLIWVFGLEKWQKMQWQNGDSNLDFWCENSKFFSMKINVTCICAFNEVVEWDCWVVIFKHCDLSFFCLFSRLTCCWVQCEHSHWDCYCFRSFLEPRRDLEEWPRFSYP